jgi:hypothetical protein
VLIGLGGYSLNISLHGSHLGGVLPTGVRLPIPQQSMQRSGGHSSFVPNCSASAFSISDSLGFEIVLALAGVRSGLRKSSTNALVAWMYPRPFSCFIQFASRIADR